MVFLQDSSPVTTADIADAMEFHDDDDFEETLRQLDESEKPKPKKVPVEYTDFIYMGLTLAFIWG